MALTVVNARMYSCKFMVFVAVNFVESIKVHFSAHCVNNQALSPIRWWYQGILKGKYHLTVDLLFDWFGLVCFANNKKIATCHTADSKQVKQEVNSTVILPP